MRDLYLTCLFRTRVADHPLPPHHAQHARALPRRHRGGSRAHAASASSARADDGGEEAGVRPLLPLPLPGRGSAQQTCPTCRAPITPPSPHPTRRRWRQRRRPGRERRRRRGRRRSNAPAGGAAPAQPAAPAGFGSNGFMNGGAPSSQPAAVPAAAGGGGAPRRRRRGPPATPTGDAVRRRGRLPADDGAGDAVSGPVVPDAANLAGWIADDGSADARQPVCQRGVAVWRYADGPWVADDGRRDGDGDGDGGDAVRFSGDDEPDDVADDEPDDGRRDGDGDGRHAPLALLAARRHPAGAADDGGPAAVALRLPPSPDRLAPGATQRDGPAAAAADAARDARRRRAGHADARRHAGRRRRPPPAAAAAAAAAAARRRRARRRPTGWRARSPRRATTRRSAAAGSSGSRAAPRSTSTGAATRASERGARVCGRALGLVNLHRCAHTRSGESWGTFSGGRRSTRRGPHFPAHSPLTSCWPWRRRGLMEARRIR